MAEILLGAVLGKLAGFTVDKVLQLCGVDEAVENLQSRIRIEPDERKILIDMFEEVEQLKEHLSNIKMLIVDSHNKHIVNETQKKWVLDQMEIAYQIEDVIDIFLLECPDRLLDDDHKIIVPKKTFRLPFSRKDSGDMTYNSRKIVNVPFLRDFQKKVENIKQRISRFQKYKNFYDTENLGEDMRGQNIQSIFWHKLNPLEDSEVVGFAEDIKNVVKNLCDEKIKRLAVVSIVGPGGIGKTALARKVFYSHEDVRTKFRILAWISISQNSVLHDVLRNIAKKFGVQATDLDVNDLAEIIRAHLNGRKYLIVLDDIWSGELYSELQRNGIFPDTRNGSRVLLTTRLVDVARSADTTYEPYQLNFLNREDCENLFWKTAIPKSKSKQGSPPSIEHLKDLPDQFIKKCKGLPIALVELGRLLSKTDFDYVSWKYLLDTLSWWQDDRLKCSKVIATSFEHLPFARKFCFMLFAAFPEDQEIEAQQLVRMWIAEGLVPLDENRTLEQTAVYFLEDLVQRSMVQVIERNLDGSIKYICVHDIQRDLAIQKAKENKFLVVCKNQDDWKSHHCREARRIAVHYSHFKLDARENIRSLLIFGESELDCSKYRHLRVLANMVKKVGLRSIRRLPHLRYLQLNNTGNNGSDFEENIKAMEFLETLDLGSAFHGDLTPWIWQIKTLRHVQLSQFSPKSTEGPQASSHLMNLQTLRGVISNRSWDKSRLPEIPQVRELDIQLDSTDHWEVIAALILKLNHLVHLSMSGRDFQIEKFKEAFPSLQNINHLKIDNTNEKSTLELQDNMLPPNLIELQLKGFKFNTDPMLVLEKLEILKTLKIVFSSISFPHKIRCSSDGFRMLEKLTLENIEMLNEWEIMSGAMPHLNWIKVSECDNLLVPPGLVNNQNLQVLQWSTSSITEVEEVNRETLNTIFITRPDMQV